jgi:hypothetical protein
MMTSNNHSSNGRIKKVGFWTEQTSSSGKRYYYNSETEVSQWKKPTEWREYEQRLTEKRDARNSSTTNSSRQNDHQNSASQKKNSPAPNSQLLNNDFNDRHRNFSKPSTSNNTPVSVSSAKSARIDSHVLKTRNKHSSHLSTPVNKSSPNAVQKEIIQPTTNGTHSSPISQIPAVANIVQNTVINGSSPSSINKMAPPFNSNDSHKYSRKRNRSHEREICLEERNMSAQNNNLLDNLLPPPIAPDLVLALDEPMDVANSPPPQPTNLQIQPPEIFVPPKIPLVMPFDEASYTNNRFYSPKLCSYRKQISYDSAMSDIKHSIQKHWKAEKDLLELETSIMSVQSLVLTAHCNSELKRKQSLQNHNGDLGGGSTRKRGF